MMAVVRKLRDFIRTVLQYRWGAALTI